MTPVRILMLEDNRVDAGLITSALEAASIPFEAQVVETREDFAAAIAAKCADLILAEFVLPAFDGMSALQLARAKCPGIPFIFVSGAIGEEIAIEGLRAGATDYVLKHRLERLPVAVTRSLAEAAERERRRRAEDALRRSEARYRTLVESVADFAIFMMDERGAVTTWNHGAELVFGYAESEILFRTSAILWTPEDRERGDVEKEMRIAEREGRAADEREHLRKDGSRFWASGVLAPIRGEDGSLQGFVKVMRDVSDRRKAEEALRSSNQELEQFAYAASHDMREPLRTVNSYAQMLQRRYGSSLDADGQAFLAFVQSGVQHMQRLLADLLAYSHLLHEKSERRRAVPLDDVLAQVLLNARGTIRETSAVITSDPLPVVLGDESQLAQVLENLIGNALKYQPAGNRPVVHVSARREDNHWTISVRDNGIGFEQEYVDRIFVLFRRLHRDQYPGSGIGLAVSKRIVEHHGGRIWAESSPGAGSTFHFTLPAG